VKETDRIAAMAAELRKLGATVVEGADFIEVTRRRPAPGARRIHTYDDHRMAMCLSLAAFNPLGATPGLPVRILDPGCVAKTFPDYFEALFACGAGRRGRGPGDHHRRPHRIGQGHAGGRPGAAPGLAPAGFRRRCTAPPAWPRSADGVALDDEAWRAWPGWHRR
jgi:3-phosphoshikimate 1-carboxyvinyltransferase